MVLFTIAQSMEPKISLNEVRQHIRAG
jgi:hypothetical protein